MNTFSGWQMTSQSAASNAVAISTERLRELARTAVKRGRIAEERDDSHPTRGALVRLSDLVGAGTKAVRATLIARHS